MRLASDGRGLARVHLDRLWRVRGRAKDQPGLSRRRSRQAPYPGDELIGLVVCRADNHVSGKPFTLFARPLYYENTPAGA